MPPPEFPVMTKSSRVWPSTEPAEIQTPLAELFAIVQATMVIETIWLREWTEPLMPQRVRSYVGIDPPELQTGPAGNYMEFGPGQGGGDMGEY